MHDEMGVPLWLRKPPFGEFWALTTNRSDSIIKGLTHSSINRKTWMWTDTVKATIAGISIPWCRFFLKIIAPKMREASWLLPRFFQPTERKKSSKWCCPCQFYSNQLPCKILPKPFSKQIRNHSLACYPRGFEESAQAIHVISSLRTQLGGGAEIGWALKEYEGSRRKFNCLPDLGALPCPELESGNPESWLSTPPSYPLVSSQNSMLMLKSPSCWPFGRNTAGTST